MIDFLNEDDIPNYFRRYLIRLNNIELKNFRNVGYGKISLNKLDTEIDTAITGFYGQNGSGKTSVIMAIDLLKDVLSGTSLNYNKYESYIMAGKEEAELSYDFCALMLADIANDNDLITNMFVNYSFALRKRNRKIELVKEKIKTKIEYKNGTKDSLKTLVETGDIYDLSDKTAYTWLKKQYDNVTKKEKDEIKEKLESARNNNTSAIFDRSLACYYRNKQVGNESKIDKFKFVMSFFWNLNENLFVIRTSNIGAINSNNYIPLYLAKSDNDELSVFYNKNKLLMLEVKENSSIKITPDAMGEVQEKLNLYNKFLATIIPGLSLVLKISEKDQNIIDNTYTEEDIDPLEERNFDYSLYIRKNDKEIPLRYESDGTRRLISLASVIIFAYNNNNAVVAIDEIDAGIFEYLLGEIISVLSSSALGQFIFTSHNMRPLEVLRPKQIYFTSTDENNRFVKMQNFSGNNNLRDLYYRTIILNSDANLYMPTDEFEIRKSLSEASGRINWEALQKYLDKINDADENK